VPRIRSLRYRTRGWVGWAALLPVCAVVVLSEPPFERGSWPDVATTSLGWLLLAGGIGLRLWGTLYLGGRRGRVLVSEGPYSLCRNPLYVGSFLVAMSVAAFLESLTIAAAVLVAAAVYVWGPIRAEERVLAETLGDDYVRYRAETPCFLPRPSRFRTGPRIDVSARGLRNEARRSLRLVWIPVLHEVVERLRAAPGWPHLFHLP
jgi:protein-S-isoprenylcysteine O-methyltransferase Ste14